MKQGGPVVAPAKVEVDFKEKRPQREMKPLRAAVTWPGEPVIGDLLWAGCADLEANDFFEYLTASEASCSEYDFTLILLAGTSCALLVGLLVRLSMWTASSLGTTSAPKCYHQAPWPPNSQNSHRGCLK